MTSWLLPARVRVAVAAAVLFCAAPLPGAEQADSAATQRSSDAPAAPADEVPNSRVIRFLEERITRDPGDVVALNRLAGEYLLRFRDTGNDADIERSAAAAARSLEAVPAELNPGGLAARGHAEFSLHRFAAARDDARTLVPLEPDKREPLELLGDALLELGDLAGAGEADFGDGVALALVHKTLDAPVRFARLALATGDRAQATRRFDAAVEFARAHAPPRPEELAWALVQAGQNDFSSGRWEQADAGYRAALEAKPGDWPALDHLAELRAAQGRFDESISLYVPLVARMPRPELLQALGDVYLEAGKSDDASIWHDRAADAYRRAAAQGSAHYYHHLAGFYCDVYSNPREALHWAREDLKVRQSAFAYDALAWALYHSAEYAPAAEAMDRALATGIADAHVLYHASLVYARADDAARGRECLKRAAEVNPKFMSFHVHR